MDIHILHYGKILCGRSRFLARSVQFDDGYRGSCQECLLRYRKLKGRTSVSSAPMPSSTTPDHVASYDPILDPLNPISPLSPFSPLHHSDPEPSRHHDPSPSYDPSPSHDHSPSHDSGSYDSGSSDSGGGGSDGGGGGGMD